MNDHLLILRHPLLVLILTFVVLWAVGWIAASRFRSVKAAIADQPDQFAVLQNATLTLLGLLIGFSFSMALTRYDQRKNLEEEEANAIGTEYLRADLLPPSDASKVRALLVAYADQRVLFYQTRDEAQLAQINAKTTKLQDELWSIVRTAANSQPSPVIALAVSGMNDVLNSQGYTQAAWWNRIPLPAWVLMTAIAVCATVLVGLGAGTSGMSARIAPILPLVVSIAFFLIADIDSPRSGIILVEPQNLSSLAQSLRAQP